MIGIYKITSPSGKVYIGQAVDIERRKQKYKHLNCKGQPRLYASLVKYGFSEHIFEVLEECSVVSLNIRERHWQDFYHVLSRDGLNCRLTAAEDKSGYLSESTKQKISIANKGKVATEQQKQARSERLKGKPLTRKEYTHSDKTKEKISIAQKNIKKGPHTEATKQKISQKLTKYSNIGCYSLEGVFLKVYLTLNDVEKDNFSKVNVSRCLTGCRKSHKNLIWKVVY
jgi:group I intron endonuclease